MASPYWIRALINKTFSGRFFFSKLTHFPIIGRLVDYALFEGDDIFYLPKDRTIPLNKSIAHPESIMAPSLIVDHFIRKAKYHWIMDFCICRESSGCMDYPESLGCIFLGEAAMNINPKFGRRVISEEALGHAARCREAGLVHLIGRNKLDSVWLGVGPGNKLLTICNCCPCCCLWKILPTINPEIGDKISRMPGISVRVGDQCQGCGTCTKNVCFVDAINIGDSHAVINQEACRGCGRCVDVCPNDAIEIIIENSGFIDEAISRISDVVDVT
jgi:ferredoxin